MTSILHQAEFLRAGGYTRRFNATRVLVIDYVGMHQNNVTNIALLLRPDCRKELVVACARHDAPEWASLLGDVPSPLKRRVPGLKEAADAEEARVWAEVGLADPCEALTAEEYRVLKLADYLDGMMYCIQERLMGNTMLSGAMGNFTAYVAALLGPRSEEILLGGDMPEGPEFDLFDELVAKWESINV